MCVCASARAIVDAVVATAAAAFVLFVRNCVVVVVVASK